MPFHDERRRSAPAPIRTYSFTNAMPVTSEFMLGRVTHSNRIAYPPTTTVMPQLQNYDTTAVAFAPVLDNHREDRSPTSTNSRTWSSSASNFDGDIEDGQDACARSSADRPPPNAPKGPAADRSRRQSPGNRPPPNAPTAPAADRKRLNQNNIGRPHHVTPAVGHSNSKKWVSKNYEEKRILEKLSKQMKHIRIANSPCVPRDASEYAVLRQENLQRAIQHAAWSEKEAAKEKKALGSNNTTLLPSDKLSSCKLFPGFAQEYWHANFTEDPTKKTEWPTYKEFKECGDKRNEQHEKQILPRNRNNEFRPRDSRGSYAADEDVATADEQQTRLEQLSERRQELIESLVDQGDEKNIERYV